MAQWTRRTVLVCLFFLILVSVAIRYPFVGHERFQTDSYFIHFLADTIIDDGYAEWTFHPLSYVGYYPLSYPSGAPFMLSEFSIVGGMSIEASVLVINMVMAVLLCLSVFLIARHFIRKSEYALLATSLGILAPRFVDTSYWDASARTPAIILVIITVMILLRTDKTRSKRLLLTAFLLLLGCLTLHHIAVVLVLFGGAYLLTILVAEVVLANTRADRRWLPAAIFTSALVLVMVVPFAMFSYFWRLAEGNLQSSLLSGFDSPLLTVILTAAISYGSQIGLVLLPALAYMYFIMKKGVFTSRTTLPVFVIAVFVPIIGASQYVSMVLMPFAAILGGLWFAEAFSLSKWKGKLLAVMVVLLGTSIVLTMWSTDRWNSETYVSGDQVEVGDQIFNDSNYLLRYEENEYAISNVILKRAILEAVGELEFLGSGVNLATNGDVTAKDIRDSISRTSSEFPGNIYIWYVYKDAPAVDYYIRVLMVNGLAIYDSPAVYRSSIEYFSSHPRLVVAIDNTWPDHYLDMHSATHADFPQQLLAGGSEVAGSYDESPQEFTSFKYYQSSLISLYLVQLPSFSA